MLDILLGETSVGNKGNDNDNNIFVVLIYYLQIFQWVKPLLLVTKVMKIIIVFFKHSILSSFWSLVQTTRQRDIPLVTLVKNNTIHKNVPVLTGTCSNCTTLYSADHENSPEIDEENQFTKLYLNSAKFIKVGQSVWVDQVFSNAVVNAMYIFHATASPYMEFWNNSFGKKKNTARCVS